MNPNEFEHQISQRPVRSIPAEWREEILKTARTAANASSADRPETTFASWLHSIFWPCPHAWAGLAAVWLALAVFNHFGASSGRAVVEMANSPVNPREIKLALKQQQRELAQLLRGFDEPVAEPPKYFVPRPRSDCRPQIGLA